MFSFLQPILLLAGAGIIVPVLIHLWNTRRGNVRKVGSIELLKQNAHSQARSLRLSDRWLLLLRCLLIFALAVLLAKPFWTTKGKTTGWILIEPSSKERIYPAFQPVIDSLVKAGFEIRSFDTSFSVIDLREKNIDPSLTLPYWSLLKMLDKKLPAGAPVYLFTDRSLDRFEGERPQLSMNLHWQSIDLKDTARVQQPSSNIDSIKIVLYADRDADLRYLTAAMDAIQKKTQLPVNTEIINAEQSVNADWLFWLSDKSIPASIKAPNVFLYNKVKEAQGPAWLQPINKNEEPILFTRLIADSNSNLEPIWSDGKGQAILGHSNTQYYFNSRFRPDWNNFIWSGDFPERLFALLAPKKSFVTKDNRPIDPSQMPPDFIDQKNKFASQASMQQKDLRPVFWWLAFALFAIERFVSFRKKKKGVVHEG